MISNSSFLPPMRWGSSLSCTEITLETLKFILRSPGNLCPWCPVTFCHDPSSSPRHTRSPPRPVSAPPLWFRVSSAPLSPPPRCYKVGLLSPSGCTCLHIVLVIELLSLSELFDPVVFFAFLDHLSSHDLKTDKGSCNSAGSFPSSFFSTPPLKPILWLRIPRNWLWTLSGVYL